MELSSGEILRDRKRVFNVEKRIIRLMAGVKKKRSLL
jgi:hypothetical protein